MTVNHSSEQPLLGYVRKLETFGLVDGPGVRFVIFLQGCDMRCRYCHNPETWTRSGGDPYTPEQLLNRAWRYHNYWKDNGGITVSGGEPLLQLDFVSKLFRLAKQKGIHTALDTSGNPFRTDEAYLERFDKLLANTDLVLLDLKEMRPEEHLQLTGNENENILLLAEYLSDRRIPMWIRHVLVPGLTDDPNSLRSLRTFVESLKTVERVELLPYHNMAIGKWEQLGIPYTLKDARTPTEEEVKEAYALLGLEK